MDKRVLVLYYTQTGQLKDIVDHFSAPLVAQNIEVEIKKIPILQEYTFPWSGKSFFNAMPESVLGIPSELGTLNFEHNDYDLVVLAYQPWFLSPSIPFNSLLKNPQFSAFLNGKNVVTLIGSRNMWISAQEKVKVLLNKAGANLVGNIALVDKNSNLASAVSILHWMLNGKKTKFLGIFPKPGIADSDIKNASVFGHAISTRILENNYLNLQAELVQKGAVEVKPNLMFIEPRATKLFNIWASVIIKKKNRALWLVIFKYYLVIALFLVSPIVLLINNLLFRPFSGKKIASQKQYYLGLK